MQVNQQKQTNKANIFLDSIGRNSSSTRALYKIAIGHFTNFLASKEMSYNPETIITALQTQKVNVYELLDLFVSYIYQLHDAENNKLSPKSIKAYITAIKSYLQYWDIDIVPHKYKHRVKIPKDYREDEQPLDASDIRNLLQKCHNRRLKAFLLILASSGVRAGEACSLRIRDIDFGSEPTKIHIRKEYNKTKTARDVYISNEATQVLKDLIKLNSKKNLQSEENLIFERYKIASVTPRSIYNRMASAFRDLLEASGMGDKKDNSGRRKITLHSFRRAVFSIVSDQAGSEFGNWLIGHSYSTYWTRKETERRRIYVEQCMKHLTYLDYSLLEAHGKNMQLQIIEKSKEIAELKKDMESIRKGYQETIDLLKDSKFAELVRKKYK